MELMALDRGRFPLWCILTNKDEGAWKAMQAEGVGQQFFCLTAPFAKHVNLIYS